MTAKITFCSAYYENPGMLEVHYTTWMRDLAPRVVDIIIVDDGSPKSPAHLVAPELRPTHLDLKIFRMLKDRPWHQNACRNIAVHEATTPWVLLTDMDHVPSKSLLEIDVDALNPAHVYRPARLEYMTDRYMLDKHGKHKRHLNSWLMTRELFLTLKGYDERTCGAYGTDSFFRGKVKFHSRVVDLEKEQGFLYRVGRERVSDASTTTLERKDGRPTGMKNKLIRRMAEGKPKFLTHAYERKI